MATSYQTGKCPSIVTIPQEPSKYTKYAKLGDILTKGKLKLLVVEGKGCRKCYFHQDGFCHRSGSEKTWGPCSAYSRPDQTWVIFQKIEDHE